MFIKNHVFKGSASLCKQAGIVFFAAMIFCCINTVLAEDSAKSSLLEKLRARKQAAEQDAAQGKPEITSSQVAAVNTPNAAPQATSPVPAPAAPVAPQPVTPDDKPVAQPASAPVGGAAVATTKEFNPEDVSQVDRDWSQDSSERKELAKRAGDDYQKISNLEQQSETAFDQKEDAYANLSQELNKVYSQASSTMGRFVEVGRKIEGYVQQNMARYAE